MKIEDLYWINSPSGHENGMAGFICQQLTAMGIDYEIDEYLQVYNLQNPELPILCAHMDQIGEMPISRLTTKKGIIRGDRNIGADDKNGIWIILNILKKHPVNFIFSTCEEAGGNLQYLLSDNDITEYPYCLVFDRKGKGDIVGHENQYCSLDFENAIAKIGKRYGYSPAIGIYSDCDILSRYINCVNLSCGYYDAHTDREYTVIAELKNALKFGIAILTGLNGQKWQHEINYIIEDLEPLNLEEIPLCPYCRSELVDFVENKTDGWLCPNCQYEYVLDWGYYA